MDDATAIEDVIEIVTGFYGVPANDVMSSRRTRQVHRARCMGMYLAFKSGARFEDIGRRFGGRDYTVVVDVCRKIETEAAYDSHQAELLSSLQQNCTEAASRRHEFKTRGRHEFP